jgi:hypothetical protein
MREYRLAMLSHRNPVCRSIAIPSILNGAFP